ncbi:MAG: hypothetical protein Kow0010_07920 [Dehalococcoidia bacterium]
MRRKTLVSRPITVVAVIAIVGASVLWPLSPAHAGMPGDATVVVRDAAGAATEEVLRLRVEVSYKGWNGQRDFTIEAVEGQRVEITFVWADTAVPDNAHRIRIDGYDLRTPVIDAENREATLTFIADKPGSFNLSCDWRCEGHKEALEQARFKVIPASGSTGGADGSSASASYQPTSLSLAIVPVDDPSGRLMVRAALMNNEGEPVAGAKVHFYVERAFAGTEGAMEIGASETDESGVALIEYMPRFAGTHVVTAQFPGFAVYAPSERVGEFSVDAVAPAYTVAPKGLGAARSWTPVFVLLIVASIWITFGFVLTQVYLIRTETDRD